MSKAVPTIRPEYIPDVVVIGNNTSQKTMHRMDPDSTEEDPEPMCETRSAKRGWKTRTPRQLAGHYRPCTKPRCFGGEIEG